MNTSYGREIVDISTDSMEKLLFEKIVDAGFDIKKLTPVNIFSNSYGQQPFVISINYEYPLEKLTGIRNFFKLVRFNGIAMMRIAKFI
jgi:hypothetical protein